MGVWNKIAVLGVNDDMSISKQKSTIFFNIVMRIAVIIIFIIAVAMYFFLDFKYVPFALLLSIPVIGFSLVLNYMGKVELSVFITSFFFPIYFLFISIFAKLHGEGLTLINSVIPRFGIIIMATISFVVLLFRCPRKAFGGAAFGLLIMIFFNPIHSFFGIEILKLELKAEDVYTLIVGLTGIFIFILAIIKILQKINLEYEETITKQRDELVDKNIKIEGQKEEIFTQKAEIEAQKDYLLQKNAKIEAQNNQITASIIYASYIQAVLLPSADELSLYFETSIFFKPRDIVSGDFYWFRQIDNKFLLVTADCTGHGVPGAFLSMLGISFLNGIIIEKKILKPSSILNQLRIMIKDSLQQKGNEGEQKDGMDVAVYLIDNENDSLEFAGAQSPIYLLRENADLALVSDLKLAENKRVFKNDDVNDFTLIELKPDRMPIGVHIIEKPFTDQVFKLQKDDIIYSFSDGYIDQFGGENNEKFMSKRFKKFLLSIALKPILEQKFLIKENFENWLGEFEQLDDVLVIGLKI